MRIDLMVFGVLIEMYASLVNSLS